MRVYHVSMSTIVLIGFRGSGKTTLGRWLAEERNMSFLDTDEEVLEYLKFSSVGEAWKAIGETGWRDAEAEVIPPLLSNEAVIALGGGAPFVEEVRKTLIHVDLVLNLTADPEVTSSRIEAGMDRPPLSSEDLDIRLERLQGYAQLGTHGIDTSGDLESAQSAILHYLNNLIGHGSI